MFKNCQSASAFVSLVLVSASFCSIPAFAEEGLVEEVVVTGYFGNDRTGP